MDPMWHSVLSDIERQCRKRPRYKRNDADESKKVHEMIYDSGMDQQLENVLTLLGHERTNQAG